MLASPSTLADKWIMLLNFLDALRAAGIPASIKEHLLLLEALLGPRQPCLIDHGLVLLEPRHMRIAEKRDPVR